MRIIVKVKTHAREAAVEKIDDTHYKVCVPAPPEKGKANRAVIGALADYFDVTLDSIEIKAGDASTSKIVRIGAVHRAEGEK